MRARDVQRGKKGLLSDETTAVLEDWVANNFGNPYPSEEDKVHLVRLTGAHIRQVRLFIFEHACRHPLHRFIRA